MTKDQPRADVRRFLDEMMEQSGPGLHEVGLAEARSQLRASVKISDLPTGELAVLADHVLPGPGGELKLRLHDARASRAPGPIMIFLHGGGWVVGDLDTHEPACAEIARGLDMPVVAVDYRLAPEHPFPAAVEDSEAASRWIAENCAALGVSGTSLVVAGDSAGGNLAIVTALALRDAPAALPLAACWAIYPAADLATTYPSQQCFGADLGMDIDGMEAATRAYAPDLADPRASPLLADLAGLPPTLVTTAEVDTLRDQGRALAAALVRAGVPTMFREAKGQVHSYINLRRAIPSAVDDLTGDIAALKALIARAE